MEFCPKCNRLLVPKREGDQVYLVCPACGYRKRPKAPYTIESTIPAEKHHKIGVVKPSSRGVRPEDRELYREEYYSVFLETYESESEE